MNKVPIGKETYISGPGSSQPPRILLNGFRLSFSKEEFRAYTLPIPDTSQLKALRQSHSDWFLYWQDGTVYALPRAARPSTSIGEPTTLRCSDHLGFLAALIAEFLPVKFPTYEAFRRRPLGFMGKRDEIVSVIAKRLQRPPALLKEFTIWPTFTLEAKIVEPAHAQTIIGLFLSINTRWKITADIDALQAAGVDLGGLYVVRRQTTGGERRLVGQIGSVKGAIVHLSAAYDNRTTIGAGDVFLEGSKASFARCLKSLLENEYERFEQIRQQEEGRFFSGNATSKLLDRFQNFFQKSPDLNITEELTVTINERLEMKNSAAYQTVWVAPPVQYFFNPARTKASQYPWVGIKQYGPFSKDTFPKRTPNILVVFPDSAQGATETFLNYLRAGITTNGKAQYEGGFGKLFGLLNPTFTKCKVPLLATDNPANAYRRAIEDQLATGSTPIDAAVVVLTDHHASLPDDVTPYLSAKATLMLAGIPSQEIKTSRLSRSPNELQYILQNFTIALYAKMNGTPWTVNQDTTISDELIIGIGTAEVNADRFGQRTRYIGVTTVFRGDGNYLLGHVSKECAYDEYPEALKDTTERILQEIKQRNGWNPGDNVRLIFHTYKPLKNIEIAEITKRAALAVGTEQTIEFAFLTVTVEHPFLALDPAQPGIRTRYSLKGTHVPERGTIIQIGRYTRLVCTNGPSLIKHENTPLPAPLLVHVHKGSTFNDLSYLSEQALKFTGLSWRSTLPAKKPVSIYYSELIAELLGRLRNVSGWTPPVLNMKLRASRWFL